jgi:hypothetical protein
MSSLGVLLELFHRFTAPPDEREVPHLQSPFEDRYREEASIIVVERSLVLAVDSKGRVLCIVQPTC